MSEPSLTLRSGSMVDERTYDARERFAALFDVLVTLKDQCQAGDRALHSESDTELASVIQASVGSYAGELSALPRHSHYSRHVIGIQGDWIGYICRWEPNSASCVHGHPSFAFYQVIQGAFAMDLYKATSTTRAQWTSSRQMQAGDCIWQQGEVGCYDNLIHKVSNGNHDGYTVHLFSDDPSRGLHF